MVCRQFLLYIEADNWCSDISLTHAIKKNIHLQNIKSLQIPELGSV